MPHSPDPQLDSTDAPDRPRRVGRLGHRSVALEPADARIGLSEGLDLTWKATDVAAGPGGVTADLRQAEGLEVLRFGLPQGLGWVRLNLSLNRPSEQGPALLAVRLLIRVRDADTAAMTPDPAPVLQPSLSQVHRTNGSVGLIAGTTEDLTLSTPGWHLIEGQFLCAPDTDRHQTGLILRLPEGTQVDLGLAQTAWLAPDAASEQRAGELIRHPAVPIRAFSARALVHQGPDLGPDTKRDTGLTQALAGPWAAAAHLTGTAISGWVVADAPPLPAPESLPETPPEVVIRCGDTDLPVTLVPGAGLTDGDEDGPTTAYEFRLPLIQLLARTDPPATELSCHTRQGGRLSEAFARIPVPAAYTQTEPPGLFAKGRHGHTVRLIHAPPAEGPDPYRKLLYRAMTDTDVAAGDLEAAIGEIEQRDAHSGAVVFHLHSLGHVLSGAADPAEAHALRRDYADRLGYFVHLGGIVLWSLHGPLPEPTPFGPVWQALGQDIADLARIVHVHSDSARDRVTALWRIRPERLLVADHPSYLDHYPDYVSRQGAHARLGLKDVNGPVFLLQGQLGPDKDIDGLIAAFTRLRQSHPEAWLLIMGEPAGPLRKGVLTRTYGGLPNVRIIETTVAETTLQWYYRAADWAVLPYRDVITPKSALCAMSFGLPVIAPDLGAIRELVTPEVNGLTYRAEADDPVAELADALRRAATLPASEVEAMGEAARSAMAPRSRSALATALGSAIAQAWPSDTVEIAFDDGPRRVALLGKAFPPPQPARTSIVILNYRHAEDTARLIDTLSAGTDTDFDLYVVDNCSPDLSVFDLATRFPQAHVLRLPENLGYAAGNNAALRLIADLAYRFVWILNPDMVVPPEALSQHIAAAAEHPHRAIFGPALLREGAAPRLASAGCYVSLAEGLSTGHLYAGELPEALPTEPYDADFITGAAVFLRGSVLAEIGTIPEDYFLYFEETAWLTAARDKGLPTLVLPHIRLAHHKRSEDGDLPAPYFYYYYIRNALIFAGRCGSAGDVEATAARLESDFIAAWSARISKARPDRAAVYDRLAQAALTDGRAGKTGRIDLIGFEWGDGDSARPALRAEDLASCTVILTPEGLITGQIALSEATAGAAPCMITVLLDGQIVEHSPAVPFQPELMQGSARMHSFEMALPARARNGRGHRLAFHVNGQPVQSASTTRPRFIPRPAPALDGGLIRQNQYLCEGWLRDQSAPDQVLIAEIVHEGQIIAQGRADKPHDGAATGGFAIRLPRAFADGTARKLHLRLAGKTDALAEETLQDAAFAAESPGTAALPAQLAAMAYGQTLWFGAQDPAALPITRHMQAAAFALGQGADKGLNPLVSVILPVHNRPGPVLRALRSVLAQSYPMWELILVDDASTDETLSRLETALADHNDSRITLVRRETQGGAGAARNSGLAHAHGEVIAWLDSDDHWDPAYLSLMTAALMQPPPGGRPAPEAVYCGTWLAQDDPAAAATTPDATSDATGPDCPQEIIGLRLPPAAPALIENDDIIALSSLVLRRSLIDRLGGCDADLTRYAGWDLVLRASATVLPRQVRAALVTRSLGPDSLSETLPHGPALAQIASRTAGRRNGDSPAASTAPARPVDVILRAPAATDAKALRQRIEAVWLTLQPDQGHRLIVQTGTAMIAALGDMATPDRILRDTPKEAKSLAGLEDALACRRRSADLAILEPAALVQPGWLGALAEARQQVPEAGMLLTRHSLPGRQWAARKHAPATRPDRDVCITVSAALDNLLDAEPDGLMRLSRFEPFCTYIPADVASLLHLPDPRAAAGLDHNALLGEWADVIRAHLRRTLVYCPRAHAFEMSV